MRLVHTVKTSYEPGTYVLDGCLCIGQSALALALSTHALRVYDTQNASFVFDLREHTHRVTDLICSATSAQPGMIYSAQEDGGVMATDIRTGQAAHFLTRYCTRDGTVCNSLAMTPTSGTTMALGLGGDVVLLDTRTWNELYRLPRHHSDDVTRVRFVDDNTLCSAGEDQMILFTDWRACVAAGEARLSSEQEEENDEGFLQAISCGEVITRMSCFAPLQLTAMVGSCENGYLCEDDLEQSEVRFARPDFGTYLVDWCVVNDSLQLVCGTRDDDGNAGPLRLVTWQSSNNNNSANHDCGGATSGHYTAEVNAQTSLCSTEGASALLPRQGSGRSRSWAYTTSALACAHEEVTRVAFGLRDRLITGGEDGLLAYWADDTTGLTFSSSSSSFGAKMRVPEVRQQREGGRGNRFDPRGPETRHYPR